MTPRRRPAAARSAGAVLRLGGDFAVRFKPRTLALTLAVGLLAVVIAVVSLTLGDYPLSVGEVLTALTGQADATARTIVVDWRLPRALMALVLGAALGASGAVFQSVTRNPLGSPDVIGFTTGAYTGALIAMLVFGKPGFLATAAGALLGGLATAVVVYLLAYRQGVQGGRLIVVGIGITAMLAAVNSTLIQRADLGAAMSAAAWGVGSLNGMAWAQAGPACAIIALLGLALAGLGPRMRLLELGDDAACALGVRVEPSRLALIACGVALAAVATATAGPIAFVALAAPQLARMLTRGPGLNPAAAASMGALLLIVSDVVAQRLLPAATLPVGAVTVPLGGLYLVWLLVRQARR